MFGQGSDTMPKHQYHQDQEYQHRYQTKRGMVIANQVVHRMKKDPPDQGGNQQTPSLEHDL